MQKNPQITFRHMDHSEALDSVISEKIAKLDEIYDNVISCHVVVEAPHKHHQQGRLFHIRVDIKVPGTEIVINRDPSDNHAHEDARVAVQDAFDAAHRQLHEYVRRRRGEVKSHKRD